MLADVAVVRMPRDGRFHWLRVVDQVADEPELHRLRHVRRVVDDHVGANQPARRLAIENGVESSVAAAVEIERGLARIDAEVSLAAGNYFLNANFEDPHPARLPLPDAEARGSVVADRIEVPVGALRTGACHPHRQRER
ncbi:MAG: hypothetical protein E6J85_08060 [Deltaproteobacteria bacterium]|nr:MAG: hypothetical protein E6J85_08060 [Deltaproteobacteria bacterium]